MGKSRHSRRSQVRRTFRPLFESLEHRTMLSASKFVSPAGLDFPSPLPQLTNPAANNFNPSLTATIGSPANAAFLSAAKLAGLLSPSPPAQTTKPVVNNFNPALTTTVGGPAKGTAIPGAQAKTASSPPFATPGYVVVTSKTGAARPDDFGTPYGYTPLQLQTAYGFNQLGFLGGN